MREQATYNDSIALDELRDDGRLVGLEAFALRLVFIRSIIIRLKRIDRVQDFLEVNTSFTCALIQDFHWSIHGLVRIGEDPG